MNRKVLCLLVGAAAFFLLQGVSYVNPASQDGAGKPVVFKAAITIAQEVPTPTPSEGIGAGVFTLNAERTELRYAVAFTGLSDTPTLAHFHGPAPAGVPTGVIRTICGAPPNPLAPSACPPNGTLITGTWSSTDERQPLTEAAVQYLLDGEVYVNVHTALNPAGEIRGQVIPINAPER